MPEQLIATVLSQTSPLEGQSNRSSGNFSTESLPVGTQYLKWVITDGGNPDIISFNVMKDVSSGTDHIIFRCIEW